MQKKNVTRLKYVYGEYLSFMRLSNDNHLDIYAACSAFYILMSFIPFLVILLSLIPFLPFSQNDLENIIMTFVPEIYSDIVDRLIKNLYISSTAALPLSVIATIWSAASGITGITKGLNQIAGVNEYRNFILVRLRSAFFTLFLLFVMVVLLLLSVFGDRIRAFIGRFIVIPGVVDDILALKNIFVPLMLFFLFWFLFTVLPAAKRNAFRQIPGAILAALIWWGFTLLFALYLKNVNSYTIYGSFALVIVTMIWLYTGMFIMFMGAQLNEYLVSRKGNKHER